MEFSFVNLVVVSIYALRYLLFYQLFFFVILH